MDQLEQAVNDGGETMAQFKEKIRQEMTINEVQKRLLIVVLMSANTK